MGRDHPIRMRDSIRSWAASLSSHGQNTAEPSFYVTRTSLSLLRPCSVPLLLVLALLASAPRQSRSQSRYAAIAGLDPAVAAHSLARLRSRLEMDLRRASSQVSTSSLSVGAPLDAKLVKLLVLDETLIQTVCASDTLRRWRWSAKYLVENGRNKDCFKVSPCQEP
jgi:hypothetical protein